MPTHPMNTKTLLLFLSLTGILACGPSKSDRLIQEAELRAHDDSVKRAAEDQMKQKLEMKFALTDSINRIGTEVSTLKEALGNLKAELEVQKDKLAGLKDFQFLRSRGERCWKNLYQHLFWQIMTIFILILTKCNELRNINLFTNWFIC
jgi:septal ring factor EnvC (AmiA/AmiB activator)